MDNFYRRLRLITIIYTFLPVLLSSFFQSIQNIKNSLPSSPILPLTDISNTLCVLIDDNNFFRLPFQIFKSVIKSTKTKDPPSSSLHNSYNTTSLSIQIIKSTKIKDPISPLNNTANSSIDDDNFLGGQALLQ